MSETQIRKAKAARNRRKMRIRKQVSGTTERPRITVFRSAKHITAQAVDDVNGKTLASATSIKKGSAGGNIDAAKAVGSALAEACKAAGISSVVFDRNGFIYHGRIKALADAAREGGLKF